MHVRFLFPLSAQRSGTHVNQPSTWGAAWQDSPVPAGHSQSPHGHRAEQAGAERAPGLVLSCGCCPETRSDRGSAHARLQREFLSPLSCNLQFVRPNQRFLTPMKGHVTFDFTEAFHAHYCNQIKFIPSSLSWHSLQIEVVSNNSPFQLNCRMKVQIKPCLKQLHIRTLPGCR